MQNKYTIRNVEIKQEYHLGNNLEAKDNGTIKIHCTKYITDIINKHEEKYGILKKENAPST